MDRLLIQTNLIEIKSLLIKIIMRIKTSMHYEDNRLFATILAYYQIKQKNNFTVKLVLILLFISMTEKSFI